MAEVDGEPTGLERGFEEFASAPPRLIEECRYFFFKIVHLCICARGGCRLLAALSTDRFRLLPDNAGQFGSGDKRLKP
jgi:hypothetical protein